MEVAVSRLRRGSYLYFQHIAKKLEMAEKVGKPVINRSRNKVDHRKGTGPRYIANEDEIEKRSTFESRRKKKDDDEDDVDANEEADQGTGGEIDLVQRAFASMFIF